MNQEPVSVDVIQSSQVPVYEGQMGPPDDELDPLGDALGSDPDMVSSNESDTDSKQSNDDETTNEDKSEKKHKKGTAGEWYVHKRLIVNGHQNLNATEQIILAKKTYRPSSGLLRSVTSIHRDAFLLRNPAHGLSKAALDEAIREDLISRI